MVSALFFAVRLGLDMHYWNDPQHRDQQLEPWMTVGYVAKSWNVDRRALRDALDLDPAKDRKASLGHLARQHEMAFETYAKDLMTLIAQQKALAE